MRFGRIVAGLYDAEGLVRSAHQQSTIVESSQSAGAWLTRYACLLVQTLDACRPLNARTLAHYSRSWLLPWSARVTPVVLVASDVAHPGLPHRSLWRLSLVWRGSLPPVVMRASMETSCETGFELPAARKCVSYLQGAVALVGLLFCVENPDCTKESTHARRDAFGPLGVFLAVFSRIHVLCLLQSVRTCDQNTVQKGLK